MQSSLFIFLLICLAAPLVSSQCSYSSGCLACYNGYCTKCNTGYVITNSSGGYCAPCTSHCTACTYSMSSGTNCSACSEGYGLYQNYCYTCSSTCLYCNVSASGSSLLNQCLRCTDYYGLYNGVCYPCSGGCDFCTVSMNNGVASTECPTSSHWYLYLLIPVGLVALFFGVKWFLKRRRLQKFKEQKEKDQKDAAGAANDKGIQLQEPMMVGGWSQNPQQPYMQGWGQPIQQPYMMQGMVIQARTNQMVYYPAGNSQVNFTQ